MDTFCATFLASKGYRGFVAHAKKLEDDFVKSAEGMGKGFSDENTKFNKISLGSMTFSHSLVRVILCEQIYRCATILTNHPYHKA